MVSIGNAKQVFNLFTHTAGQNFVQRPNIVRIMTSDLKYIPQSDGDVFVKATKQISETFIKADKKLFSWEKPKPIFSMKEVNPESLVLIHRTNYFPEGGKIVSTSTATKNAEGIAEYRPTIHFSLNKSVTEHAAGNEWNAMEYSIILPFKETVESMPKSKVIGGIQDDFFFIDSVKLPKGSIILKHNPSISQNEFKVSEAFDGVKLVETSAEDMVKTTDLIIEKMGYTSYNKALQKHLGATDDEMRLITSVPEVELLETMERLSKNIEQHKKQIQESIKVTEEFKDIYSPKDYDEIISNIKQNLTMCDITEKYYTKLQDLPNSWLKFCNKNSYYNGLHQGTAWAKIEWFFNGLNILVKGNKESWIWNGNDYKTKLMQILNNIRENIPLGKDIGIDLDKLIDIVKHCKSPESAQNEIMQNLKIKAMKLQDRTTQFKKAGYDDTMIADINKIRNNPEEFMLEMLLSNI